MHTSGIVVVPIPGQFKRCRAEVDALAGIEVATGDQASNKLVAVLETESVGEQENLLRTVQGLETVALAELVCHYFGDETSSTNPD